MKMLTIEGKVLVKCDKNAEGIISIPDTVSIIGESAFFECLDIKVVIVPDSVTLIENHAFGGCKGLETVILGDNVESIGQSAFEECVSLRSVHIPRSVKRIEDCAFQACDSLESICVDTSNNVFDSREGCNAIIETFHDTLVVACKSTAIPDTVTHIGENAFITVTQVESVTIPSSVIKIGDYAFAECEALKRP